MSSSSSLHEEPTTTVPVPSMKKVYHNINKENSNNISLAEGRAISMAKTVTETAIEPTKKSEQTVNTKSTRVTKAALKSSTKLRKSRKKKSFDGRLFAPTISSRARTKLLKNKKASPPLTVCKGALNSKTKANKNKALKNSKISFKNSRSVPNKNNVTQNIKSSGNKNNILSNSAKKSGNKTRHSKTGKNPSVATASSSSSSPSSLLSHTSPSFNPLNQADQYNPANVTTSTIPSNLPRAPSAANTTFQAPSSKVTETCTIRNESTSILGVATPRSKNYFPTTTPTSKRSLLSQRARRPTPQSQQAKLVAYELEKNRLQTNSMYSQNTGKKGRISGHAKRLGSARRPTVRGALGVDRSSLKTTKKVERKLVDSITKELKTPGNDHIPFGCVRFSPTSGATMKINFNKNTCPPVSTPQARKNVFGKLKTAMSAVSVKRKGQIDNVASALSNEHMDKKVHNEKMLSLSPLTSSGEGFTSSTVSTMNEIDEDDIEVQQLLSSTRNNKSISLGRTHSSAFSRLDLRKSHSPITIFSSNSTDSRDTADPLGRTLKCQTDLQSKDAIRGFCSSSCTIESSFEDHYSVMDENVFKIDDDEPVSFSLF